MHRAAQLALSTLALAALISCGGGDPEDTNPQAQTGDGRAHAQAFIPPKTVPQDANVNGMWSDVYPWPLISVHSVILPDGRVLTYGSDLNGLQTGHANYDVWDSNGAPNAGHMTLTNATGTDIFCSSQLLLPLSGNAFIAGGDVWNGTQTTNGPNNNSNLFNSANNGLTRANNMLRSRWYSSSTTLVNGETYIQGGSGGGDRPEVRGTDGTFRLLSNANTSSLGTSFPRNFVAPDGRVFGYDPGSGQMYYVNAAGTGTYTTAGSFSTSISGGWESSTAMYRPGRILQIGGNSNGAYTIDITSGAPVVAATQSMSSRRAWVNATILADGKVVATSGSAVPGEATGANNIAEIWDPATGRWTQGASAQKMRLYHSNAILLPDASVLVSGGGATAPTPVADPNKNNLNAEIYYPPYLFAAGGVRAPRPDITNAPTVTDIGKTFGIDVANATGISRVTLVKTGSMSHSFNFDQRFLELTFKATGSHLAVQAPTRAADATPGFYMLFVFDQAGVPSVAKMLRIGIAANPNPAVTPTLATPAAQTTLVGTGASLQLSASDPNGDALTYAAAGLPPNLTIDASTGLISGTATDLGSYDVVVSASDGVNTASAAFVWTVQPPQPLTLQQPATPAFVVTGGTATYTASAVGGANLQYRWTFGDGTSADWSSSASVTHVYAAAGIYDVTVYVRDASGAEQSRSFQQAIYLPTTAKRPNASSNVIVEPPASGNARLWVVNQDNDSISGFDAVTLAKLGEVALTAGAAPRGIALAPNGLLWVTNKQAATISIVNPATRAITRTITLARGSMPFGVVMSPTANLAYVALEAGGSVLRFDTGTYAQTGTVTVGPNVRHLSISADGANLYASRFVTPPLPGEGTAVVAPTASTGGEVLQIGTSAMTVTRTIVLRHGDTPDGESSGRGIPNYLAAATISPDGKQAWVPSKQDNVMRGLLRDGNNLNFQNTVRAISSRIDLATNAETPAARIDHDNASMASAAVYDQRGVYLFVALETSREVAVLNAYTGEQLLRVDVGRAPQGLALAADGKRLFVNNFMERNVTVLNLAPLLDQGQRSVPVLATLAAVATEKLAANVLLGKQHFYDARDTRLARDRYMSCASCHNDGGHDGRVWDLTGLGEGLRNTISLRGRAGAQGFLHWSNNFDEVQDFEGQIRNLAGGTGLMSDAAFNAGTRSTPLGDKKAGQSPDLDALAAYVGSLAAFDPSPKRPSATTLSTAATAGKTIFAARSCGSCHAGTAFSGSGANTLVNIGTVKPSSGSRLGGPLTGIDVPTLRDVWATAPYLHDGSAATLELAVRAHRGVSITDADLANLTAYLREIGSDEAAPAVPAGPGSGMTGFYFNNIGLTGSPQFIRNEAVDFAWGTAAPGTGVAADNFSVRWSGSVVAPSTGSYRFQTSSDDGVRLYVNGALVIGNWTDHSATDDTSGTVNLTAGQSVAIVAEYYERGGDATMRVRWQTPGESTFVALPANRLVPAIGIGGGTGLAGSYYNNTTLSGTAVLSRTEAVNFSWGSGSPGSGVNSNNFSARWTGTVLPTTSGSYKIQTVSDAGVRVWVNGTQLVNNWTAHNSTTNTSAAFSLVAGQRASITVEYYETTGSATMQLKWLTPGVTSYVAIPAANLFVN